MTWRDRLAALLGAASPFAFATSPALAADSPQAASLPPPTADRDVWVYSDPEARQRLLWFAGHSSHASHASHSSHYSGSSGGHASHASHSSHYSGSVGDTTPSVSPTYTAPTYVSPPPASRPSPPPTTTYVAPAAAAPALAAGAATTSAAAAARPTRTDTRDFIQRLQIALIVKGYDPGPANGVLSPATKAALKKYQTTQSLPATGFMDVATLRRLGVMN